MAKKTTAKSKGVSKKAPSERRSTEGGRRSSDSAGEAFIKLLQSPLVAELVAVAATAALAALAEQGFSTRGGGGGTTGKRAGRAVKAAGVAAAAAVGRRLNTEIEEIRRAAKESKSSAKA
jgi:coproporphyrinogen III oxidase